jgi:hypothetical protein
METSEANESSGDCAGLPQGKAFRLGSMAITGVAGGLLLSRALAGFLKIGLSSIVPVVVYQVLRKPAGSRKVISSLGSAESHAETRQAGLKLPETFPQAEVDELHAGSGESDPDGFPVFFDDPSTDCLPVEDDAGRSSFAEDWRAVTTHSEASSLSAAEWAASALDEIEDKRRDTGCLERQVTPESEGQAGLSDGDFREAKAMNLDWDPLAWRSAGEEMACDPGETPQATQWHGRGEPDVDDGRQLESVLDPVPVVMDRAIPVDEVDDEAGNTVKGAGLLVMPREPAGMEESTYRRVPADTRQVSLGAATSAGGTQSFPEEPLPDAFSLPFPGRPVPGVQSVENPFSRGKQAGTGNDNPGALATVILQEKRKPGKRLVRGNVMLGRMCMVLIIAVMLGGGVFLAWQALNGTGGDITGQSSIIGGEGNDAAGDVSQPASGREMVGQRHDFPAEAVPKPAGRGEKFIHDEDLPSFRSLE